LDPTIILGSNINELLGEQQRYGEGGVKDKWNDYINSELVSTTFKTSYLSHGKIITCESLCYKSMGKVVIVFFDISDKLKEIDELKVTAMTDPMTNIYNRRGFNNALSDLNSTGCFAMLDIDFFKKINDTYGHDIGDIAIKKFATLLKESFRGSDIISRWGGEEFLIFLSNIDEQQSLVVLNNFNQKVKNSTLHPMFTCSIGYTITSSHDFERALICCDKALYRAKNQGRDRVEFQSVGKSKTQ
ncbi:GGDEF domain-containing protein, partial [Vibrio sp. FNV 38]|nr:GGDEF domain-containing protein [Vibrio sp. FNV 38]